MQTLEGRSAPTSQLTPQREKSPPPCAPSLDRMRWNASWPKLSAERGAMLVAPKPEKVWTSLSPALLSLLSEANNG